MTAREAEAFSRESIPSSVMINFGNLTIANRTTEEMERRGMMNATPTSEEGVNAPRRRLLTSRCYAVGWGLQALVRPSNGSTSEA